MLPKAGQFTENRDLFPQAQEAEKSKIKEASASDHFLTVIILGHRAPGCTDIGKSINRDQRHRTPEMFGANSYTYLFYS